MGILEIMRHGHAEPIADGHYKEAVAEIERLKGAPYTAGWKDGIEAAITVVEARRDASMGDDLRQVIDMAVNVAVASLREMLNVRADELSYADLRASGGLEGAPRPHTRPDGFPTRSDMQHWSEGERAIFDAVQVVEHMGGSPALTDAVNLLQRARSRVADHVEGETGSKISPPSNKPLLGS